MKKHAASHGLALLVCTVTAGILIKIGRDHYPMLCQRFEELGAFVANKLNLGYSPKAISTVILAVFLAVIWGIAFSFMHSDEKREKK